LIYYCHHKREEEAVMSEKKRIRRKAKVSKTECVACGCCVKVCPKAAIHIYKGIYAVIDQETCVGCGRCAKECPASVITIMEV
jgi:ferredoxin